MKVDSHNIVPCWVASDKCEFSAKTIRKKIHNGIDVYLEEFPSMREHAGNGGISESGERGSCDAIDDHDEKEEGVGAPAVKWHLPAYGNNGDTSSHPSSLSSLVADTHWESMLRYLGLENEKAPGCQVKEVVWAEPGERGGLEALRRFVGRVDQYDATR